MKVSKMLGKRIMSCSGKEGYVFSVNADKDGEIFMLCADDNEKEFALNLKNATHIGKNTLFEERADKEFATALRLGKACFDEDGKCIGRLEDFIFCGGKLKRAKIGKKNYPAEGLILGDVIIVKSVSLLKSDVVKNDTVLFKKGTPITDEVLEEAVAYGEYVQTRLKSL